jgi:DNA-binding protein H-NS
MGIQSRVFAREYKSRSSKLANSLFQEMTPQDMAPEIWAKSFASPHRSNTSHRAHTIRHEAESVFRPKATDQHQHQSVVVDDKQPVVTGRILPCLSQLSDTSPAPVKGKARHKAAGSLSKSSSEKAKLTSKRTTKRLQTKSSDLSLKMRSYIMSEEFAKLSNLEILSLIERAKQEIVARQNAGRERLKEEIQAKLANSGLDISDLFPDAAAKGRRKSNKNADTSDSAPVPAKYRDPVSQETWSGRGGRPPHWVKKIMEARSWTLEDFKKSGEYDI